MFRCNLENATSKMMYDDPRYIIFNGTFYTDVSLCRPAGKTAGQPTSPSLVLEPHYSVSHYQYRWVSIEEAHNVDTCLLKARMIEDDAFSGGDSIYNAGVLAQWLIFSSLLSDPGIPVCLTQGRGRGLVLKTKVDDPFKPQRGWMGEVWDMRKKDPIFSRKEMDDYVSKMVTTDAKRYLVCSSGEGTITSINLVSHKLHMQDLSNLVEVGLDPKGNQVRCGRETGDWPTSLKQGLAIWLGMRGLIDWPTSLEQGLASWLGVRVLIDWLTSLEQGLASWLGMRASVREGYHQEKVYLRTCKRQHRYFGAGHDRLSKLVTETYQGTMFLFNWGQFGYHSDEFPGVKQSINSMIPITENIVVTACEDGVLSAIWEWRANTSSRLSVWTFREMVRSSPQVLMTSSSSFGIFDILRR
uniref:Uncharacterized protein n=1 Tax=Timema genevievae TaxID=629358 RepID=A0A7R9PIN8_TIMGE|nr:unnamed protein product [Timema genevievae]